MHNAHPSILHTWTIRLKPGDDLKKSIDEIAKDYQIAAGVIITCVGSLMKATIRFAGEPETTEINGPLEIVSLTGTLATTGSHIHISLSDKTGKTIGGHLKEGNAVYTTAELCIGVLPALQFTREKDETTGYPELTIKKNQP
ncbi:MAG: PPC domain-containing DNA-binding protein [Bacteroidia bacterium]